MDGPEQADQAAIIAQGGLDHMKELRGVLRRAGIDSELRQPPEGQGSS